jgi:hypothetical protein
MPLSFLAKEIGSIKLGIKAFLPFDPIVIGLCHLNSMIVHSSSIHCRYLKSVKETAKSGELENERHLGFFKGNG